MNRKVVAGVYIERDGVTVMCASHDDFLLPKINTDHVIPRMGPELRVEALDERKWHPKDSDSAIAAVQETVEDIVDAYPDIQSIAVAGFGTFVSLMRSNKEFYGKVHEKFGHDPFKGINLHNLVRERLLTSNASCSAKVSVHTDAHAYTLGEAINRSNEKNHLLVGILCTEGIGGGIVRGNSTFQSALHPEFGLITPRIHHGDDILKKAGAADDPYWAFSRSFGEVASTEAMRQRFAEDANVCYENVSNDDLLKLHERHWEFRSYYLAQLCFICTSLLAPHGIVVASDLDPNGTLLDEVVGHFDRIAETRELDGQPMLDYEQYRKNPRFVSGLSMYRHDKLKSRKPSIPITGALGACLLAARVSRGGHAKSNTT
ncbi:ROK family protein [Tateyamaria sp. ANG-S1]|uniref:ROK family protein n=1 Tax=Tateyamaria sp. ANG-S1 TaxID=1577905 RepID=UPI000583E581|nr:ROK family protein [Tateyamaria sp. ANG-S1]KIC50978.1 hypothetical protein RA29_03580 [Tateyamaria sp. ANG-S1]